MFRHAIVVILLSVATVAAQPTSPIGAPPPEDSPPASAPILPSEPSPTVTPTQAEPVTSPPIELQPPPPIVSAPPALPSSSVPKSEPSANPKEAIPLDIKPGGYLQIDTRNFATGADASDILVRRLRFRAKGTAFKYFKFNTLIDTAGSKLVVDDAWIEFSPRPEFGLRVGKDKAQFGIERLQSATELAFIERAYPTQLSPNRDIGVALRGDVLRGVIHYSAALVDGVANNAILEGETDNSVEYDLHLLISPFKANSRLATFGDLGIGGAATFGRTRGTLANPGITAIKSDGQATIFKYAGGGATDTLDTTAVTDGYRHRLAAHATYYGGPVGVLAEYVSDHEPVSLAGTHTLLHHQAWQLAGSVALTPGDRPSYKGIAPTRAFDLAAGTWGAVELAGRYSELRVDDATFDNAIAAVKSSVRRARAATIGANWYLNRIVKLQLNYVRTSFIGGASSGNRPTENLIATRFQVAI